MEMLLIALAFGLLAIVPIVLVLRAVKIRARPYGENLNPERMQLLFREAGSGITASRGARSTATHRRVCNT